MRVTRTYPQPDSPKPNIGPRERALAVFKYLLNMEPEDAVKHPRFVLIVAAFTQEGNVRLNRFAHSAQNTLKHLPKIEESIADELKSARSI